MCVCVQVLHSIRAVRCRCMGTSGSCAVKHCFVAQASYDVYVTRLRELYDEAVEVQMQGSVQAQTPWLRTQQQQRVLQDAPFGASVPAAAASAAQDGAGQERRQRGGMAGQAAGSFGERRVQQPQPRTPQGYPPRRRPQQKSAALARSEPLRQVQAGQSRRRVRRGLGSAPVLMVARKAASSSSGAGGEQREPLAHELVYHKPSPDFCVRNDAFFVPGTAGRACNKTSSAVDACELICCGRGYSTRREKVTLDCNCQFSTTELSTSYVCSKCQEIKEFYTCN